MAEEQQEAVEAVAAGEEEEENDNPDYKPPAPKSLDEILEADKEDESLRKYKEQLLGGQIGEQIVVDPDNTNNVIVRKLAISVDGRDDVEIDLTMPKEQIKECKVALKEGCKYRVKIMFHVQREIVAGLKYEQKVFRKGIKVDKASNMVGSYGPKKEEHIYTSHVEDAPSGLLSRGEYKIQSRFTDDDKHIYLEWEWYINIKKEFDP